MKYEKQVPLFLMVIVVINIILASFCLCQSRTIIRVNNRNEDTIYGYLSEFVAFSREDGKDINSIKQVGIGNGWLGKYKIYIYDTLGNVQELEIYEGDTESSIEEIRDYIKKNGYDFDEIAFILIGICIIVIIYLNKKEKKYEPRTSN